MAGFEMKKAKFILYFNLCSLTFICGLIALCLSSLMIRFDYLRLACCYSSPGFLDPGNVSLDKTLWPSNFQLDA